MAVCADNGRWFAVRYLPTGARYGRTGAVTVDQDTVEFWDLADADDAAPGALFGPLGQFVSRYYVTPLLDEQSRDPRVTGLCLDGGNASAWSVDGPTMRVVFSWLRRTRAEVMAASEAKA
jgi:hypothetical protein